MKKLKNIFSFLLLTQAVSCPALIVTSCSKNTKIYFSIPEIVSEDYFEVDCFFSQQPSSSVNVLLFDQNSNHIRLCDPIVIVENKKTKLRFEIDATNSMQFNFKIKFIFKNEQKKQEIVETKELNFLYSYFPDPDSDRIVPKERRVTTENIHSVQFDFIFYVSSQVSSANLEIVRQTSNLLTLNDSYCDVHFVQRTGQWIANVIVNIDESVQDTSFINFDLQFTFTNTFGKTQITVLKGLSIAFVSNLEVEMPSDYFKIEKSQGNKYTLVGLNDWVDPNKANLFSVIRIPDIVNVIGDRAFSDSMAFKHIRKIIFNDKLLMIGYKAFSGCTNVSELDLTVYLSSPVWIKNSYACFDDFVIESGYIWFNNKFYQKYDEIREICSDLNQFCALSNEWEGFTNLDVIPDDFYDIQTSETSEDKTLVGFVTKTILSIPKYRIIKIPDGVTHMSRDCLIALASLPYQNLDKSIDFKYLTRHLILPKSINEIVNLNFCGISGLLNIEAPNLKTILTNSFQDMRMYSPNEVHPLEVKKDPLYIHFINCDSLETIEQSAFYGCGAIGNLELPASLNDLKENAFGLNDFSSISVLSSTLEIREKAFSHPDASTDQSIKDIYLCHYLFDEDIEWMTKDNLNVFSNACLQDGIIHFSANCQWEKIVPIFKDFLKKQGIPDTWYMKLDN